MHRARVENLIQNNPYSLPHQLHHHHTDSKRQNRASSQFELYEQLDRFSTRRNTQLQRKHVENTPKSFQLPLLWPAHWPPILPPPAEPQFCCHACRASILLLRLQSPIPPTTTDSSINADSSTISNSSTTIHSYNASRTSIPHHTAPLSTEESCSFVIS